MSQPTELWTDFFRTLGFNQAEVIGRGMEGEVFRLTAGLVGKVWHSRQVGELRPLRDLYAELAGQRLPFATPEIVDNTEHAGRQVTIERYLPGESLRSKLDSGQLSKAAALEATVNVVAALQRTTAGAAARSLPVLSEGRPLWAGHDTWSAALACLVQRRADRFAGVLRASVTDFDRKLAATVDLLNALPATEPQLVHGDICPENILASDSGEPTALLDWGFVSTAGDNAFEAAAAAGFFDMYGRRPGTTMTP